MDAARILIQVDGRPATSEDLALPALVNYGHYTSMQVRDRRVRGLGHHLDRLTAATRELFDVDLDPDMIRDRLRAALTDAVDASVRVNVFRRADAGPVSVMVTIRPPAEPSSAPQRLLAVAYQRPVPHLKHVGSFAQTYYGRLAVREGYDDALLTGPDGVISETTIANIGFFMDGSVRWPDAPCLIGTSMAQLGGERGSVRLADLPSIAGAFVANSTGVVAVRAVDAISLPVDDRLMRTVQNRFDALPWDAF